MQENTELQTLAQPGFQMQVQSNAQNLSAVIIEPLEQGYGHTLGNALRRVLLTSLSGSAITLYRVSNADHQFDTIEGVTEDVFEIGLNLKQVRIKSDVQNSGKLRLNVNGPKTVTAADIECEAGFEVVNTDQYIATVAKGTTLEIEMTAQNGVGYITANEKASTSVGEIPLDALYSPVVRVSYTVEATRVGSRTDYDKLILNVQTDGSIEPKDAVIKAAQILVHQFNQVINPSAPQVQEQVTNLSPEEAEAMRLTVEELDLPTRIANALRKGGFKTVGDLQGAPKDVIAKVKNLGEKSVSVINNALAKKGASLGE